MRPFEFLFSLLLGASGVQADGAAIAGAVDLVRQATLNFSASVINWDGQLQTAMPVSEAATIVYNGLIDGKRVADESDKMSIREALGVKHAFHDLINNVTTTVDLLIEAKPKFQGAWLRGSVLLGLRKDQLAAGVFARSILAKVPSAGKPLGRKLGRLVNGHFDRGVEAYKDTS